MLVRPATPADAAAIAAVHVASWQGAYRGVFPDQVLDGPDLLARRRAGWERLLEAPADRQIVLVADDGSGRIAGFVYATPARDEDGGPGAGEIAAIYALPSDWGTGVGRALMAAAVDQLRAAEFTTATLWVLASNARARRFYERAGWLPDGAQKDDVVAGTPIREVRYRRVL